MPIKIEYVVQREGELYFLNAKEALVPEVKQTRGNPMRNKPLGGVVMRKGPVQIPADLIAIRLSTEEKTFFLTRANTLEGVEIDSPVRTNMRALSESDFTEAVMSFRFVAQGSGMVMVCRTINQFAPEFSFVPDRIVRMLDESAAIVATQPPSQRSTPPAGGISALMGGARPVRAMPPVHYRETFIALFWKHDLSGFETLLLDEDNSLNDFDAHHIPVGRSKITKHVPKEDFQALTSKWIAFKKEDDALLVKFANQSGCRVFDITP